MPQIPTKKEQPWTNQEIKNACLNLFQQFLQLDNCVKYMIEELRKHGIPLTHLKLRDPQLESKVEAAKKERVTAYSKGTGLNDS